MHLIEMLQLKFQVIHQTGQVVMMLLTWTLHYSMKLSVPADSTLEVFGGQKLVLEATDVLTIGASAGSVLDATLSVLEIT